MILKMPSGSVRTRIFLMDGAVVGVDACKAGWVGVVLDQDGRVVDVLLTATIASLVSAAAETRTIRVVGIDIPIGLPDRGERPVDAAARKLLKGAASSVFTTPTRSALSQDDPDAASKINREFEGKGISRQSWGLKRKILDVDGWLEHHPAHDVIEVHPELAFQAMAGHPLRYNKRSWAGVVLRQRLLSEHGLDIPIEHAAGRTGFDDVADAGAAAWSAFRKAIGRAVPVLDPPVGVGQIWY